ncbi:MAG: tetratricopeptide repeat protein [Candidatus Omnitrophica bacterium]|nr:tetratricopeptide repeat protein [Candidatus Omnitrophota bacterium]
MRKATISQFLANLGFCALVFFQVNCAEAFVSQDRISTSKSLAHYAMGQVYDLLGQTNKAVMEYENAVQFDEGSYLIHLRLGANYARLDMLAKAKEELNLVNRYNPEDLQAHYLLALIYSTEKDYDNAAKEYEHILKAFSSAEPENIEIYGYLGQLYYSQKKYKEAIVQFEKILSLEPQNPDVLYLLGSLYLEIDDKQKAIDLLMRSVKLNPDHDGSLNTLGYIYAEIDLDLDEAEKMVNRALIVSPKNGAYLDSLGWIFFKKGNYQKAIDTFLQADEYLKDPIIYEHLGDVYFKMNKIEDALKYWELSLELLPGQKNVIQKIESTKSIQARKNTDIDAEKK